MRWNESESPTMILLLKYTSIFIRVFKLISEVLIGEWNAWLWLTKTLGALACRYHFENSLEILTFEFFFKLKIWLGCFRHLRRWRWRRRYLWQELVPSFCYVGHEPIPTRIERNGWRNRCWRFWFHWFWRIQDSFIDGFKIALSRYKIWHFFH